MDQINHSGPPGGIGGPPQGTGGPPVGIGGQPDKMGNPLGYAPVSSLMLRFAIPSIIGIFVSMGVSIYKNGYVFYLCMFVKDRNEKVMTVKWREFMSRKKIIPFINAENEASASVVRLADLYSCEGADGLYLYNFCASIIVFLAPK